VLTYRALSGLEEKGKKQWKEILLMDEVFALVIAVDTGRFGGLGAGRA